MSNLTKSERLILATLDSATDKVMTPENIRQAVGLTMSGMHQLWDRMEDAGLIVGTNDGSLEITYRGIKAIGASA